VLPLDKGAAIFGSHPAPASGYPSTKTMAPSQSWSGVCVSLVPSSMVVSSPALSDACHRAHSERPRGCSKPVRGRQGNRTVAQMTKRFWNLVHFLWFCATSYNSLCDLISRLIVWSKIPKKPLRTRKTWGDRWNSVSVFGVRDCRCCHVSPTKIRTLLPLRCVCGTGYVFTRALLRLCEGNSRKGKSNSGSWPTVETWATLKRGADDTQV